MVIPLPQGVFFYWPDWIPMIMVFWALTSPDRFGPWVGFVVGILLEVIFVRKFGIEGLALASLIVLVNRSHLQLRVLSVWQQTIVVVLYIAIYKLIAGWLNGLIADFTITREYWYSLLGDLLIWPFLIILLNEVKAKAKLF